MKFLLNSDDSELLLALEASESLLELSILMKRDASVLSRRLNKMSQETNFIKKLNGKWILTDKGLALNQWTRKAINEQSFIFSTKQTLKIASTREFASRILIPNLEKIIPQNCTIEIVTTDGQSENLLLDNLVDIAIDCGTPYHPDIRFKKVLPEKMVLVSSKLFYKKNKILTDSNYLHFVRNDINMLQEELNLKLNPKYIFNDLSSLRAAITSNLGFGYIPYYVVKLDLQNKSLHDYEVNFKSPMSFGVWWKKDFKNNELISNLTNFLKTIELN